MGLGSRKRASAPEGDHGDGEPPRTKKNKTQVITQPASFSSSSALSRKVDENGNRYWEISKLRRVTVSSFRGKTMVHLREYYEKDGLELPGKKGISLPMDQFATLVAALPEIETTLKEHGETVPRPAYTDRTRTSASPCLGVDEELSKAEATCSPRKNIEATSDEDEGED